jgi:hypothetical protein
MGGETVKHFTHRGILLAERPSHNLRLLTTDTGSPLRVDLLRAVESDHCWEARVFVAEYQFVSAERSTRAAAIDAALHGAARSLSILHIQTEARLATVRAALEAKP